MNLTILGSNSATQVFDRYPSSQILTIYDQIYMIDCGEGTIFKLSIENIKKNKIRAIFISHLHGDHYFGLPGLLTTMSMHQRSQKLTIVAPKKLKDILDEMEIKSQETVHFPIEYIYTDDADGSMIYSDKNVMVKSFPLVHNITTTGFLFSQRFNDFKILPEKIKEYGLNNDEIRNIIENNSVTKQGKTITLSDISIENKKSKTYAYCSDSRYDGSYSQYIQGVDVLYHEATFLEEDIERAKFTEHSTAIEAATAARDADAKRLLIGHYSSRYQNLDPILAEAKTVFNNTELAIEHKTYTL